MDDLISRQAAIAYAISGRIRTLPTTEDGENWIRVSEVRESLIAMPSAQQWIPCSEGLPKTEDVYLVTVHPDYVPQECKQVDCMYYYKGKWRWLNEKAEWEKWPDPIIAWMPLPEPYKAERKEE